MKRYYFVSDDLKDLAIVERELQSEGVSPLQMHLVSDSEAEAEQLGLNQVASVFKKDILYSMVTGMGIGCMVCALLVCVAWWMGVNGDQQWFLVMVISFFIIGFCTWEGGLFGIQVPNRHFKRYANALQSGRHLFFVDVKGGQKKLLDQAVQRHSHLKPVGIGGGEWEWWLLLRSQFSPG